MTTTLDTEQRADAASADAYVDLIARLSHQSVVKHFDAYADVAWDDPEMRIDPEDPRWEMDADGGLGGGEGMGGDGGVSPGERVEQSRFAGVR